VQLTLLAYTQPHPGIPADHPLRQGQGTFQENLIEFAGRVCYRSDAKMGHNPGFIMARVREGHEDIVEHTRFVFKLEDQPLDHTLLALVNLPTVAYTDLGGGDWILSLNARNVRDFWTRSGSDLAAAMVRLAYQAIPAVYADLPPAAGEVSA